MSDILIILVAGVLALLVLGKRSSRFHASRPLPERLDLAASVDDNALENGSPYILVRDENRARVVST